MRLVRPCVHLPTAEWNIAMTDIQITDDLGKSVPRVKIDLSQPASERAEERHTEVGAVLEVLNPVLQLKVRP